MGFGELFVVVVIGLFVVGPKQLPDLIRQLVRYWLQLKNAMYNFRSEVERELKVDDVAQDVHNEQVLKKLKQDSERDSTNSIDPSA